MDYVAIGNDEPYVVFGMDELVTPAHVGDWTRCDQCGGRHQIEGGTDQDGNPSTMLMTYPCGGEHYMAAIDGRWVIDPFRNEKARTLTAAENEAARASAEGIQSALPNSGNAAIG